MRNDILYPDDLNFKRTVKLVSRAPSFLMFPTALFKIGHQFKWKARFIVGVGYLYALCYNNNIAKTTFRELQNVMSTTSVRKIYELLDQIETLDRLVVTQSGGVFPEHFVKMKPGKHGGTVIELILPQELSYVEPNNRFFPVPKLAFLLPTSAQAKAIYIYMHYLKNRGSNVVEIGIRKLAKDLRLGIGKISKYIQELKEIGIIAFTTGSNQSNQTEYYIKSYKEWEDEVLFKIREIYGNTHPFLKEWEFVVEAIKESEKENLSKGEESNLPTEGQQNDKSSHRETAKVPIGKQQDDKSSHRETAKVPIGKQQNSQRLFSKERNQISKNTDFQEIKENKNSDFSSSENLPTTSISTTSERITTSIYDDIYIGGGEKFWNLVELLKSLGKTRTNVQPQSKDSGNEKEKRKNRQKRGEKKRENEDKRTNSYKKPDGFKNKEKAGELAKPNFAERLDKKELGKIRDTLKRLLPELRKAYPEVFTLENLKVFEELYAPALKRIYGDEWLPLAIMYELFNRKAPQYGYSRKVNKNFLGLLISFALKDSSSDFWEFYKKFRRVFGLRLQEVENVGEKEQQGEQPEPRLSLSDLKEFFKKKLKDKKTIYTMFIENGIKALEKVGSKWVVKCRDSIAKEYISKNFLNLLREFLKSENIQIEV